jgi:hypothetical protein
MKCPADKNKPPNILQISIPCHCSLIFDTLYSKFAKDHQLSTAVYNNLIGLIIFIKVTCRHHLINTLPKGIGRVSIPVSSNTYVIG